MENQVYRYVNHLAEQIGNRPIGSEANLAAANYIAGVFLQQGYQIDTQDFPCPCWNEEAALLELNDERLAASANTFSPACDVHAQTVAIGTIKELRAAAIRGKLLIFYGSLAQSELAAQGAIYVSPRDREIIDILHREKPAGIITVNPSLYARWRLIEDFDLDIPSVTVSARDGLKLLRCAGKPVHMQIDIDRHESHSANVIGRKAGKRPEKIVLCAHYDTKVDTAGAYDNAAGVAVILALAEAFSKRQFQHSLEFVCFSGEEIYGLGDMTYASHANNTFGQIDLAFNFDGVGPLTGTNTIAAFETSVELEHLVEDASEKFPGILKVEPWPASDHYIFYSNGVPSLAMTSLGIKDIYHTPADTLDWISPGKLEEALKLATEIIEAVDEKEPGWFRTVSSHA